VERAGSSLHRRIEGALERAARAHEASRALIAECDRASKTLRDTIDDGSRRRRARTHAGPPRT
jgi:hypothetical protein